MTRIRDADFEANWMLEIIKSKGFHFLQLLHLLFGIIAMLFILIQSVLSNNIIIFTVWMSFTILIILLDLSQGSNIKFQNEVTLFGLTLIGTLFSMYFANIDSMFFIDNLNRKEILLYQFAVGFFISLRLFISLYFESMYSKEFKILHPNTAYAENQLTLYKNNLLKTDFVLDPVQQMKIKEQFSYLLRSIAVPLVIIFIFIGLSFTYASFIYFLLPPDTWKEFLIKPAFILFSFLFIFILVRLNNSLPQLIEKLDEEDQKLEEEQKLLDINNE